MKKYTKEKDSFSEREEYVLTRNIYIEGQRNSANNLQNVIILVSTGGFVYTQTLYKDNISSCILLISWILFAIGLISSILNFYWSGKSHELQLKIYDIDNEKEKKTCETYRDCLQKKLDNTNFLIDKVEQIGVLSISLGIISVLISFL